MSKESRIRLSKLQASYVASVRETLGYHLREARSQEERAAKLWASTLRILSEDLGVQLPPETTLEGDGLDLELVARLDQATRDLESSASK